MHDRLSGPASTIALMQSSFVTQRMSGKRSPPPAMARTESVDDAVAQPAEKARILLVEDEYLVAMTLENDLTDAGYDIIGVASSADDAVSLAHSAKPTLIVMDIRLVGARDGVDAALQIFAETGRRCVFATANADARSKERAAPAQPLGWLQKPYQRLALLTAIEEGLREVRGIDLQ
jgi:two-component system, response regulator PdtaR